MLNSQNINPREINPISRLAIVGETGMGALSYKPEYNLLENKDYHEDYDSLALSCKKILNTEYSDDLDNLFKLGTLIAKRQDDHMSWSSYENINRQSAMYYGTLEHCKKVIKTVLLLGKHYISTVDCFVKYIDKHFTKHSDSTTVAQS